MKAVFLVLFKAFKTFDSSVQFHGL